MYLEFTFLDKPTKLISGITEIQKNGKQITNYFEDISQLYSGKLFITHGDNEITIINGDTIKSVRIV